MRRIRQSIQSGGFLEFKKEFLSKLQENDGTRV
jgi:queuine/archaeosine tRNA-ribosyltransferase